MAGVTENGFTTKRMGEVIVDLKQAAKPIFQDLVKPGDEVDTGDTTTIGRLIGLVAPSIDDLWQAAHSIYQAFDIDSAVGVALDNLVAIGGIVRLEQQAPRVDLYLTGRIGTTTPSGVSAKSSRTALSYATLDDASYTPEQAQGVWVGINNLKPNTIYTFRYRDTFPQPFKQISVATGATPFVSTILEGIATEINSSHPELKATVDNDVLKIESSEDFKLHDYEVGDDLIITYSTKTVRAVASEISNLQDIPNEVNIVETPVYGWEAVRNPLSSVAGRNRETDAELRDRFKNSRFDRATNIMESLYSALYQLFGINTVVIYENDTSETDDKGIPPHSFLVIVDGGSPIEIGKAIWQNRPTGIKSVGNSEVDIVDTYGYTRTIRYSRPVEVPVYIQISLTTNNSFPSDGEEQIKQALIEYVNKHKVQNGIVFSRLYTPINSVQGHQVDELLIGTDPNNLSTQNIDLLFDQVARTSDTRITFV